MTKLVYGLSMPVDPVGKVCDLNVYNNILTILRNPVNPVNTVY